MKEIHNNIPYEYGSPQSIGTYYDTDLNLYEVQVVTDIPITATGVFNIVVNGQTYAIPVHNGQSMFVRDSKFVINVSSINGVNFYVSVSVQPGIKINSISVLAVVYGYGNGKLTLIKGNYRS